MSLFVSSLNSGSNGNCYYVGNQHEAVLIDSGISCRETEKRMKRLGLEMKTVKAIFITHEHGDHIHGVSALSKKFQLPVYITDQTLKHCGVEIQPHLTVNFNPFIPVSLGRLTITAIPKHHDAVDPHSFIIESETVKVGVFTDIGFPCSNTVKSFSECHAAFLESNYDEMMLENGPYPIALKKRIRGGYGHLSNSQACKLFKSNKRSIMTHLFLSHLSAENNNPEIALSMFKEVAGKTEIILAPRHTYTRLYHVRKVKPDRIEQRMKSVYYLEKQLNLF